MARTDTFNNWATDIADSIREKTGKTDKIPAANFDTEIASIETGGGSSTVTKGIVINEFDSNGYATDASVIGITSIPDYYFGAYNNSSHSVINKRIKNIHLPDSLNSIGKYAFSNCSNLISINLPENLNSISEYTFNRCSNLILTKLPDEITSIGKSGFSECSKIALENLPENLTSIGGYAFNDCSNLKIKEIPSGVTAIESYSFSNCSGITELKCLGVITKISGNYNGGAFSGCSNLTKIVFPNITTVSTLGHTYVFKDTPIESGTGYIYVPDALVDSFKSATNWSTYANQIKPISELEVSS